MLPDGLSKLVDYRGTSHDVNAREELSSIDHFAIRAAEII
jgi:hypothetical protein